MTKAFTFAFVAIFLFAGIALGQTSNASISGFVQDASKAFVPGVTVTLTNTQTGVTASAVTNETGTYLVQSLLPGVYRLTASLPGFRTHTVNDMTLGAGAAAKYNIVMEVGQVNTSVEVAATASSLIADTPVPQRPEIVRLIRSSPATDARPECMRCKRIDQQPVSQTCFAADDLELASLSLSQ